jgi:cytochrome bd-type quinol oxidase subunit 2
MNSATFARASARQDSSVGDWLLHVPGLPVLAQWSFIVFEVAAVVLLFPKAPRHVRNAALVGVVLLHAMTFLMIGISFLPHTVCLAAFFPLERLSRQWREQREPQGQADTAVGADGR